MKKKMLKTFGPSISTLTIDFEDKSFLAHHFLRLVHLTVSYSPNGQQPSGVEACFIKDTQIKSLEFNFLPVAFLQIIEKHLPKLEKLVLANPILIVQHTHLVSEIGK